MLDKRLKKHKLGYYEVKDKPSDKELNDYYSRKYYQEETGNYRKSYPTDEISHLRERVAQREFVINKIVKKENGKLLDVGCGEGIELQFFHEKGWDVEGIDFSLSGMENINPKMLEYSEKGNIYTLLDRKIKNQNKYDVIWLKNVLEHITDPIKLLKDLRKLINKKGCLVLTIPNDASDLQEHCFENKLIKERFWITLPDHLSYFNYDSIKNIGQYTGYKCKEILGDFPVDLFLLHSGSNYVEDKSLGPEAHNARIQMSLLLSKNNIEDNVNFYSALAKVGLGRDLAVFFTPA